MSEREYSSDHVGITSTGSPILQSHQIGWEARGQLKPVRNRWHTKDLRCGSMRGKCQLWIFKTDMGRLIGIW